jgi:hypothetical protein
VAYTNPQVTDFKTQFSRDFPYGTDPGTTILDADISNAFTFTNISINPGLFNSQGNYTLGYLLLTAHFLVLNIRSSTQGINGQYNFLQQSKSVGPLSEAFAIPQRILDNPELAMLCKTNYGSMFVQLILPQLTGAVFTAFGTTKP